MTPNTARSYPWTTQVGASSITLRLMTPADKEMFREFVMSLPEEDLFFLLLDVRQPQSLDIWMRGIESGKTISLIAVEGGKMVGYGNLHMSDHSWTRHVGEVRLQVARSQQGKGLGKTLAGEVFSIARGRGLQKIMARMSSSQQGARQVFENLGFQAEALLADYVIDAQGRTQDLVIMSYDVSGFVN
ncbi:MAG: GNAT family N-acetyltransferase [Bryobacteraceae bacterium]